MRAIMKAFKKAVALDSHVHRNLKVRMPDNFDFMKDVEIVPLTYSEILAATMYYPVLFGIQEGGVFPFAVIGINNRNVFLEEEGHWKVDVIPNVCKYFPFGILKDKDEYTIIFDERYANNDGQRVFDDDGSDTEFFSKIKAGLTELARDFYDAEELSRELFENGYLKPFNLDVETKVGKMKFNNVYMANLENLSSTLPEKLYTLNANGSLLILHAHYLSLRNFKLFNIFA